MRRLSIRIRLTAWYAAVTAAAFVLFGVAMLLAMRRSITYAVDEELAGRLKGVQGFLEREAPVQSLKHLQEEFNEHLGLTFEGDQILVTDDQGNVLYRSGTISAEPVRMQNEPWFETVQAGREQLRSVAAMVTVGGARYFVRMATPLREFNSVLRRFELLMSAAIPLALLIAAGGGYWMSRQALRPVDEITKSARLISERNLSQRLSIPETSDELQRLSETLNEMIARLEAAFSRITQFTADASHELRTPISLARTTAELALRRNRSEAEYREALAQILVEMERTTVLLEDLMTLARTDAGAETLNVAKMDLVPTFEEVRARAQIMAQAKSIAFQCQIPQEPVPIVGDAKVLRRLLLILVDNAIKYTPAGGEVALSLTRRNGTAVGEVRDSGIGMAAEEMRHIFERFYRADKARSRDEAGSGLGLSIASWIAEAHGATIEVESSPGDGSLFRVCFPSV